jgi:outer membrane immunogenic protein
MKWRLLSALLALGAATGCLAGELPPDVAPPRALPYWEQTSIAPKYFTWTGGYIGFQVGGAWQQLNETANAPLLPPIAGVSGLPGFIQTNSGSKGAIFGGHLGFNYQFTPHMVAGLEGDAEGSSIHNYAFTYGSGFGPYSLDVYDNIRGSIRARLGYAHDHWLLYTTAGAAWANFNTTHNFVFSGNTDQANLTPVGWTVGAGVEYAFMGNLSARLEYRYADYGSLTVYSQAPGLTYNDRVSEHTVRGGISYRFWAPPPPAAPVVSAGY